MSLKICSIASGSSGNCVYVASDNTHILIDAGASTANTLKSLRVLGASGARLNVLITHTHSDHISGLGALVKATNANVFVHEKADKLKLKGISYREFGDNDFSIGNINVSAFILPHDSPNVGFSLKSGSGGISFLTDLGAFDDSLLDKIKESDILYIESNHDENMLQKCSYPYFLKRRILSREGHLSNSSAAKAILKALNEGYTRQIILGHLSKESNTPELAYKATCDYLTTAGAVLNRDYSLDVAPRSGLGGLYEVK